MPSSQSPADRSQLSSQTPSYQWFQVISASLSRIRLATCGLQPLATWRLGTQLMTVRCDLATAFGSCPSWDRTRTLLIQSRAVRVCLEDTMSVSGCPPSIGARRLGGQCPDRPGETLVKRL